MSLTAPPTAPSTTDPATFASRADALVAWHATNVAELEELQTEVTASSATAIAAANFKGTWASRTGPAAVPYCVAHLDKYWMLLSNIADITVKVPGTASEWQEILGAATFAGIVAQGGNLTGAINEARGTVAMHATTMDLWTSKPDVLDGTGAAVTITAIVNAPQAGARRTLYPIAGTVITNGATFAVDGAANYTTAAGDALEFEAVTTSTYKVHITKKDGTAVVAPTPIQPISASVGSSALTISASALSLNFRSTTLGSGTVTKVSGTPANLVISSGSTLGTTSAQLARLAVLALNNAGTIELAAVNIASGLTLDETGLISTTAEGGAGGADSAATIYSTTARSSKAYRVIGYIESTQATAGTWATAPSAIQGAGGNEIITSRITSSATIATTSGTAIDITGIPPWAKRITVMLSGVSTSGSNVLLVNPGYGSPTTSGYASNSVRTNGTGGASYSSTSGFVVGSSGSTELFSAAITMEKAANRVLVSSHVGGAANACVLGGGNVTLSGELDMIRLTTVGGIDTFDAGSLTVTWE